MAALDLGRLLGFKPRLVPTLFAVPGVIVLLGLGTWQLERLQEKNEINAFRAARVSAPAAELPAVVTDIDEYEFRRVTVRGTFRHDRELIMNGNSQRGNPGKDIITPLIREAGPPVLINRGWVPPERANPQARAAGQVAGPVTVEGVLRREPRRLAGVLSWLVPIENDPVRNQWFWFDLPAMAQAAGLPEVAPYYIEAAATPNPGGFPIGGQTMVELPSNHLQYAITWYSLALALAVIFVVWHRQRE
jgi:surfeit locus 1 family protein